MEKGLQEAWIQLIQFECFRSQHRRNLVLQHASQLILIQLHSSTVKVTKLKYKTTKLQHTDNHSNLSNNESNT